MINTIRQLFQMITVPLLKAASGHFTEGVSVLICCKNEGYNIPFCLTSVAAFADQIICVDNGSTDGTLEKMQAFRDHHPELDIKVLSVPDASLREARNCGLKEVDRKWLLNCGGDFVFYTSGKYAFPEALKRFMRKGGYRAWRLAHVNLYGDLHHTYKGLNIYHLGEHYFFRMSKQLIFRETEKFDYLQLPKYYIREIHEPPAFFHMDGMKSDERLLYRNAYFEWRQLLNTSKDEEKASLHDFGRFFHEWKLILFHTTDNKKLKFRFQRQLATLYYQPYAEEKYYPYPEVIRDIIEKGEERFMVSYKEGKPYLRTDLEDTEMKGFVPEKDDLEWDIEAYNRNYHAKDYLRVIKARVLTESV